jgi:DNA-binding CsgD family transcriptional regulator
MNLTRRQTEILTLIAEGYTDKQIARRLHMSTKTVAAHLQRVFDKLNVRTRAAAVARWMIESDALDTQPTRDIMAEGAWSGSPRSPDAGRSNSAAISDDDCAVLRVKGYLLVRDLLTARELNACQRELRQHFPACSELLAAPERYQKLARTVAFPFQGPTLNWVSTHPALIDLVERLLGVSDLRLSAAILQARYSKLAGECRDQRLHNKAWERSLLVYPPESGIFQRIFVVVYYTDMTAEFGPDYVVPCSASNNIPLIADDDMPIYPQDSYPDLYAAEQSIVAPAGSVLITTGRTIQRGSTIQAECGHRFAQFMTYHAAAATWLPVKTFDTSPGAPTSPALRSFMKDATPRQRELLGFPPPGHAYWTQETLARIAYLYPGMDLTPYRHPGQAPASTSVRILETGEARHLTDPERSPLEPTTRQVRPPEAAHRARGPARRGLNDRGYPPRAGIGELDRGLARPVP